MKVALQVMVLLRVSVLLAGTEELPFTWRTNADDTIDVRAYTGTGGVCVIPFEINGKVVSSISMTPESAGVIKIGAGVTSIWERASIEWSSAVDVDPANPAFSSIDGVLFNKNRTELILYPKKQTGTYVIPTGVTNIGAGAFFFSQLTNVVVPSSVRSFGGSLAFSGSRLTSVVIPDSVIDLGHQTFECCLGLTNVTIGNRVVSIGFNGFGHCQSLTNIVIPDSVVRVEADAFWQCSAMKSITVGVGVESLGERAFLTCGELEVIYFKGSAPKLDGEVFDPSSRVIVYHNRETKGWGSEFSGRPTAVWGGARGQRKTEKGTALLWAGSSESYGSMTNPP